jgi:hypothetical protein
MEQGLKKFAWRRQFNWRTGKSKSSDFLHHHPKEKDVVVPDVTYHESTTNDPDVQMSDVQVLFTDFDRVVRTTQKAIAIAIAKRVLARKGSDT